MQATSELTGNQILTKSANQARGLAMDAVEACKSGHLGLPLGAAEIGAVLWGAALKYNPDDPEWLNRDRFVLSAGHGSMFLYSWLHIAGYNVTMNDLRHFRTLHSKTPGHPEFHITPGIEATTGPLGQGVGNAVGMALSAKMAAARYNTGLHTIIDHHVVCLAGDGCMQEGVAMEAIAAAAHWGLDNLILIYDANEVTLDAMAAKTQSENTAQRFLAIGFDVVTINGHDMDTFYNAYRNAKTNDNGKPKLIIAQTLIGKGIPEVAGTAKAHGESGVKWVNEAKASLGLHEKFHVSQEVYEFFATRKEILQSEYNTWKKTYADWKALNPGLAQELEDAREHSVPVDLLKSVPNFDPTKPLATRVSGGIALNAIAKHMPTVISGSADLHGSTKNYIDNAGDFSKQNPSGRNIFFGIREHAMGAIINGIGYYGVFRPSGATFLVFSDYMRPAIRLAALSHLPIFYIFTHDSIGVGQDGPTHQPIEHISALRLIPNLDVIRPADAEETAGAFIAALQRTDGPTALILTRQDVPSLNEIPVETRREGVLKGAYIALKESTSLERIILASGSELQHALKAAKTLGEGTRVISMPCMERFKRLPQKEQEFILPKACKNRIAIEAGVTPLWHQFIGTEGSVIGINTFGLSAPGEQLMELHGMSAEALLRAILTS